MKNFKKGLLALTIVVGMAIFSPVAFSAVILDQSFEPAPNNYASGRVSYMYEYAQTFSSGVSGQLAQVDLFISGHRDNILDNAYDLSVDLRPVDPNGVPVYANSSVLVSTTVPHASVEWVPNGAAWVPVDMSQLNFDVTQGAIYAITLRSTAPLYSIGGKYDWYGQVGTIYDNVYAGGSYYYRDVVNYDHWFSMEGMPLGAMGFRTYVETGVAAVPEPASILLFGLGGVGLALRRRFQKNA